MSKKFLGATSLVLDSLLAFTGCQKKTEQQNETQEEANAEESTNTPDVVTEKVNKVSDIHVTIDDSTDEKMYESLHKMVRQYANLTSFKRVSVKTGASTDRQEIIYTGSYYYSNDNGSETYYVLQANNTWRKYYENDYGRKLYVENAILPEIVPFNSVDVVAKYSTKEEALKLEHTFGSSPAPEGSSITLTFSKNSLNDNVATLVVHIGESGPVVTGTMIFNENGLINGVTVEIVNEAHPEYNSNTTYTYSDVVATDIVTDFSEYHAH